MSFVTPAHVVEPGLCGCGEGYLDLGRHYRQAALWKRKDTLDALKEANADCYPAAAGCYRAAAALLDALPLPKAYRTGAASRAPGAACAETLARWARRSGEGTKTAQEAVGCEPAAAESMPKSVWEIPAPRPKAGGRPGRALRRFYHGQTPKGPLSLPLSCRRVRVLRSELGLAAPLLQDLAAAYLAAGYDVRIGEDPLRPGRITHLEIPEEDLGYALETTRFPCPGARETVYDLDRAVWSAASAGDLAHIRTMQVLAGRLLEEGDAYLRQAKRIHDALEAEYRDAVDFAGVEADTAEMIALLRGLLK